MSGSGGLLAALGNHQRQFQCLFVVQSRIDLRTVGARQVRIRKAAGAAGAFGHVLAGHLQVHATQARTIGLVHGKGQFDFLLDVLQPARLVAPDRRLGVAVHRVAHPQHRLARLAHGIDEPRQVLLDFLRAEAMDDQNPRQVVPFGDVLGEAADLFFGEAGIVFKFKARDFALWRASAAIADKGDGRTARNATRSGEAREFCIR